MIILILFLAYIAVGSVVTVLSTYVADFVDSDAAGDVLMMLLVMLWPMTTLPLLVYGLVRKLCDSIFKD